MNSIDENKFYDLYSEILKVRVEFEDTSVANPRVKELFIKFNYPEEIFREDFLTLSKENESNNFAKKLDSIRKIVLQNKNK